jgi:hypothetical protein
MSNPTTPFSWQMPTATDLVTDLPADFEVFGQAVATSMADLLGGTTGQILSKTSNTNMDFTWINNDQGDITGVTAGTGITVTDPTGPVPTVTNAMATTITTAGDLIYGTGSGTFTRRGIGTAGQILQVNSGATAPEWVTNSAGGMTLLNAGGTALSGDTTISSIAGTYKHLFITVRNATANVSGNNCLLRLNGDSGANYRWNNIRNIGSTVSGASDYAQTQILTGARMNSTAGFNTSMDQEIWVYNYTSTDSISVSYLSMSNDGNTAGSNYVVFGTGHAKYDCTAAITSITIAATDTLNAGRVYVYGVS